MPLAGRPYSNEVPITGRFRDKSCANVGSHVLRAILEECSIGICSCNADDGSAFSGADSGHS